MLARPVSDRDVRRRVLAGDVEHRRDRHRPHRHVGDHRVDRVAEPRAVEDVLERPRRVEHLLEEVLRPFAERLGPRGLLIDDASDLAMHPVLRAAGVPGSSRTVAVRSNRSRWRIRCRCPEGIVTPPHPGSTGYAAGVTARSPPSARRSSRRCSRRSSPAPFDDPDWLFEVKWDGFRVEAVVEASACGSGPAAGRTPRGYFGPFLAPPTWIEAREAIVDGEVDRARRRDGEPDFALLQERIKGQRAAAGPTALRVRGVRPPAPRRPVAPRRAARGPRRRLLADVLRPDPRVRLSEHVEADGLAFFEAARVARARRDHGQGPPLAVPARQPDDGLAEDQDPARAGARRRRLDAGHRHGDRLGALLVGVYEDGALRYAGKVGAGFTGATPRRAAGGARAARRRRRRRSIRRRRGAAARARRGSRPSSSSAPSSPAGPATAWSARRATRASTSARTHEP